MIQSNYRHSIRFGSGTLDRNGKFKGVDTYEDWHLIPTSRPTISMPGIETKYVEIPGVDGSLDLSEFLRSDRPAYGDRSGTFEFYVENLYDDVHKNEYWMTVYPKIVNALHGRKKKMVLWEDDPDYFWEGRFSVDKYEAGDGSHSVVAISYQVRPFKWKIRQADEPLIWDNFNFEREYDNGMDYETNLIGDGFVRVVVTNATEETRVTVGNETLSIFGDSITIIREYTGSISVSMTGPGDIEVREGSL